MATDCTTMELLIFGDSIAYGANDSEGGWAARLRVFLDNESTDKLEYITYVLGISAETTQTLLNRFEQEAKSRIIPGEELAFIFQIGINDACYVKSKKAQLVPLAQFAKNISELIRASEKYSSKILFLGLTQVDESKTNPLPWSKTGKCYKNETIRDYNAVLQQVCEENGVRFLPLNMISKKMLEDGLHPNSLGHKTILEAVKNELER